ncbi:7-deoxyloganetin glucosyltransferase-like [Triticum dicoccoides]|uniref:7-deoxyloganetin glucosyltransferase-like n=1 Tax=Triticum dicoccoides TaxID=85692 RepID=UPI001890273E|nr:7-deoxyloganetin glucosyltransferase-like [Triticum dicoccoides]
MATPHAVVVPHPSSGNINPALQLAKLLHHHGVYITFVNTKHNHRVMEATEGSAAVRAHEGFRFEAIPDGLVEADRDHEDYDLRLSAATSQRSAEPLKELLLRLNGTPGVPPVTCVLPTVLMSFALDVAQELGAPSMVLWTCSATSLMAHMRLRELTERGYVPLKDESCLTNGHLSRTVIEWIPGMPRISLGDTSSFVCTTDPDDFGLRFNIVEANGCTKAGALILNTFDDLEADVLGALRAEYPRIYTVGPLGPLLNHHLRPRDDDASGSASGLGLWKQDSECLAWLDTQQPGSIVYANFGSLTVLSTDQLAEFAWGLAASGQPFLWSIWDNLVPGAGAGAGLSSLPAEFVAATAGRCFLTTWCPQDQVLGHPAVGCFLTHNGWNSTCESMAAGVPMVCWPGFVDQYTNCKYACEVWGVGVRLDNEVRREQVASHVRHVMKAEDMRGSTAGWKVNAEEAAAPGGVSWENLRSMVKELGSVNAEA